MAVLKLLTEARNRQPKTFIPLKIFLGDPYQLEGKLFGAGAGFETENEIFRIDHINIELNSLKGKG